MGAYVLVALIATFHPEHGAIVGYTHALSPYGTLEACTQAADEAKQGGGYVVGPSRLIALICLPTGNRQT